MKYKYNDRVLVTKDEENDGFYVGLEGRLCDYRKESKEYQIVCGGYLYFWVKEDQIQKI